MDSARRGCGDGGDCDAKSCWCKRPTRLFGGAACAKRAHLADERGGRASRKPREGEKIVDKYIYFQVPASILNHGCLDDGGEGGGEIKWK